MKRVSKMDSSVFRYTIVPALIMAFTQTSYAGSLQCYDLFKKISISETSKDAKALEKLSAVESQNLLVEESKKINKLSASWEISREGIGDVISSMHEMDNIVYYTLTAIMAKENILVDGPGGGAKTMVMRKVFEAQLRMVNTLSGADRIKLEKEKNDLKQELVQLILADKKETDPAKKIFTQQFHATLSETKILGGPDPFKFIEDGKYAIDYSKALISDKNMFAIIDEIEKGPISLQMTLLSILNERQALVGNQIIQTMLETVVATTNATSGEMIAQALPHEVGGRKALIDRFSLKVHSINVSADANDQFLLWEKAAAKPNENKFVVIDIRGLRSLIDKVKIPEQMLSAMTDITLDMDRYQTDKLNKAEEAVAGSQQAPDYFPAFSGSTRTQSKVIKLWTSAFLVRQLMENVPFDQVQLTMKPKDLIDIAPALMQGGPDQIVPAFGYRVKFVQVYSSGIIQIPGSNSKNPIHSQKQISNGYYDPNTKMFNYISAATGESRWVKYDSVNKKMLTSNKQIQEELQVRPEDWAISIDKIDPLTMKYMSLEKTLENLEKREAKTEKFKAPLRFKLTGRIASLVDGEFKTLRTAPEKQLRQIQEIHEHFLAMVNTVVDQIKNKPMTFLNPKQFDAQENYFKVRAARLKAMLKESLNRNDSDRIEDVAALTVRGTFQELRYRFLEGSSNVKAIFLAMLTRKNVMLFGPPGSAKTMLSRMILEAELKNISDAQLAKANSVLADILLKEKIGEDGIWVKQFHPMSTEGDVVGRIDLKALRNNQGYTYNRTGSLAAKEVLFALLDEFEKAPAGVKTALLSILNERELMDGDEVVKSGILAVVIATNATFGQFMVSLGDMSTSFPIFDRIQKKAYSINKLTVDSLKLFHRRIYAKVDMQLHNPLFMYPLTKLAESYTTEPHDRRLLAAIHQEFMSEAVKKSNTEHEAYTRQQIPDFYMNTRGESNRSSISSFLQEFAGSVLLNKILEGKTPRQIRAEGNSFDPIDLIAFSELYSSFNGFYKIEADYNQQGIIFFKVVENDMGTVMDRLDSREKKTIEDMKFEADTLVSIINRRTATFIENQRDLIAKNPNVYPSLFASNASRKMWNKLHEDKKKAEADATPAQAPAK